MNSRRWDSNSGGNLGAIESRLNDFVILKILHAISGELSDQRKHRAQVHIRGYGVVHTGVRKRRTVDLISFDMVIKIN